MASLQTNRGAKRAREARASLGLDDASPVPCVLTLVEERAELPVIVGSLPEGFAGALWRNGVGSIVWVNGDQVVERQRFTVAHELGHVRCGHAGTAVDTNETIFGGSHDPREVEANAFAAELLAPAAGVRAQIAREPNLEDLVRLAARYGISTIAALYRCRTLGLVSAHRYDQLLGEINEKLHVKLLAYLDPATVRDVLAETEHPRLPPSLAGSALAAVLDGKTPVSAAASAAGCPTDLLAAAAAALAR
jgi:Zn-dependent peptidase ImmA (M78 family)